MGPLGESGGSLVGKGGESDMKSRHLQGGSVRWVGPCDQVLNVLVTWWRYESNKPI
jgi:hypothetical protein